MNPIIRASSPKSDCSSAEMLPLAPCPLVRMPSRHPNSLAKKTTATPIKKMTRKNSCTDCSTTPLKKTSHWLLEDDQNNEPYSDLRSLPTEDIADAADAHS